MKEKTLVIIKPDAVKEKNIGNIIKRFEENNFNIIALKMIKLDEKMVSDFYAVHKNKPFFINLIKFMTSDRCIVMVLEGENIIVRTREFIGETDPAKARPGTIRHDFGKPAECNKPIQNVVHASDTQKVAEFEVNFFFPEIRKEK